MEYEARIKGNTSFEEIEAESPQMAAEIFFASLDNEDKVTITSNELGIEVKGHNGEEILLIAPKTKQDTFIHASKPWSNKEYLCLIIPSLIILFALGIYAWFSGGLVVIVTLGIILISLFFTCFI